MDYVVSLRTEYIFFFFCERQVPLGACREPTCSDTSPYVFLFVSLYNTFLGDNSVSLRRIWTTLGGNSSYKLPGASYTAQGHQKQPEINKQLFLLFDRKLKQIVAPIIFPLKPFLHPLTFF